MKLFKGVLGTTLIAIGIVATSNVAFAGGHEKLKKYQAGERKQNGRISYFCKDRNHKLKREGRRHWCYFKKQHQNTKRNDKNKKCEPGFKLYKNDAEQYKCATRQPPGWRLVNIRVNTQNVIKFKDVEWKEYNNQRYAWCGQGYKVLNKGSQIKCARKVHSGWSGYKGLIWNPNKKGVVSTKVSKGIGSSRYPYDNYRYIRNGRPGCKQGKPTYDNNYTFHCK